MKILKVCGYLVIIAMTIYLGVFALWLVSTIGCLQYVDQHGWADDECNQNSLTQMVVKTHAPLIKLMIDK